MTIRARAIRASPDDLDTPALIDELRRLLFATVTTKLMAGIPAVSFAVLLAERTGAAVYLVIAILAALATVMRAGCVLWFKNAPERFSMATWERLYGVATLAFSLVLVGFMAAVYLHGGPTGELMITLLVLIYCTGMVARTAVRPAIATLNILIVAVPLGLFLALQAPPEHLALSATVFILIFGCLSTVKRTHRITREHLEARQRFARLAAFDPLTGLPNRSQVLDRLNAMFRERNTRPVAIHFVDLDHFKDINDTHGHRIGDGMLEAVARRLSGVVRPPGFAARFGGDEFLVIQPDTDEAGALALAERIVALVSEPVVVDGAVFVVSTSVGCRLVEPGTNDWRAAIEGADHALYEAKRGGRSRAVAA